MAWRVTARDTNRARNYDGRGSTHYSPSVTFFDEPTAERRAQALVLPDSRFSYVTVEEVFDAKCPHCRGEMQEAS